MGASWIDRLRGWIMAGPPVIEQGSEGDAVVNWQHIVGIAPSDGVFGPITDNYTKSWQRSHGIEADGVVGPLTWRAALNASPARVTGKTPASGSGGMDPLPMGAKALPQAVANNPAITNWAIELVHTPSMYPRGSVTVKQFGDKTVAGRIEDHTWTHRAGVLVTGLNPPIRGASLYLVPDGSEVGFGQDIPGIPYTHSVSSIGGEYASATHAKISSSQIGGYEYGKKKGLVRF
jgi:hypothetical protein